METKETSSSQVEGIELQKFTKNVRSSPKINNCTKSQGRKKTLQTINSEVGDSSNSSEKKFSCQVCHKSYATKQSLNLHTNVHDESKAFKCEVCWKVFDRKSKLASHRRTHTGEKPHACRVCNRRFAQKSNLVQHETTHSDAKAFKCDVCPEGRYFKTKCQLSHHMVYHRDPEFSCSHCGHKSHTRRDLKRHENIHFKA